MRAVIDTNVLLSALFWGRGPRRVVDLAVAGGFQAVTSVEILAELEEVLAEDFGVAQEQLDLVLRDVLSYAEVVEPQAGTAIPLRDPGDVRVVACAIGGRADFIITGDRELLRLEKVNGVRVVSVRGFLDSFPLSEE